MGVAAFLQFAVTADLGLGQALVFVPQNFRMLVGGKRKPVFNRV
jgi:hypothetical protein